ncbi:MAG: tetratricopeptide repeat protein, partial [Pseudonocardiales bacterium]
FGRTSAAARLVDLLHPTTDGPTTIAVTGPPGVGKTALAYYSGLESQHLFDGGAVYVDLNGHAQSPQGHIDAEQIYRHVLLALCDEDWGSISGLDAGIAGTIYHRKMKEWSDQGRSVLLALFNVSDRKKIDDLLLWKYSAHQVLITARNADFLDGLPGLRKLRPLEPLDDHHVARALEDAVREQHPDDEWLSREPSDQADAKLAELFGGLTEEVTLVEGLLAGQPGMRMEELIRQLDASHLAGFTRPAERVFRLSWQYLNEERGELGKQATRLLLLRSVNPGPDISTEAAAALAGITKAEAVGLQWVLHCVHLINDNRWGMPSLVREYVTELAEAALSADDRAAAFGRLLRHYTEHATDRARKAGWCLLRHNRPGPEPDSGDEPPTWTARLNALSYFETERLNLLNCLRHGARLVAEVPESGLGEPLVNLTNAMAGYLRNNGPWETAEQLQRTAADIAEDLGDLPAQAIALNDLGITRRLRGDPTGANQALEQAHRIFGELSDSRTRLLGQANTLNEMGIVANDTGRKTGKIKYHKDAIEVLASAWDMYRLVGDIIGMANSAKNRGVALALLGEPDEADEWLKRSLARYRQIDDVLGEVEVHNQRGRLHLEKDTKLAIDEFESAINLLSADNTIPVHSRLEEARAYEGMGRCQAKRGAVADALTSLEKAKDTYSAIGADWEHGEVAKELDK